MTRCLRKTVAIPRDKALPTMRNSLLCYCGRRRNLVVVERHDLFTEPVVQFGEARLQRLDFIPTEHTRGCIRRAEPARVARHDAEQLRRHAARGARLAGRRESRS